MGRFMSYCTEAAEQIPCPAICDHDGEHSHWRCPDGYGWIASPGHIDWYDLTQPARLLYPAPEKLAQRT
jgi:hypothetical protein